MAEVEVVIPQINVNDVVVKVLEWFAGDGELVTEGSDLYLVETSKTTVEVEAPATGYLRILLEAGQEAETGSKIGCIAETKEALPDAIVHAAVSVQSTNRARALAESHGFDIQTLDVVGIVTERHVLRALEEASTRDAGERGTGAAAGREAGLNPPITGITELSPVQRGVVSAIERSKREVVSAYLLDDADVTDAVRFTSSSLDEHGLIVHLADLVLYQTARALRAFPLLNAAFADEGIRHYAEINIGLLVEVQEELFVSAIRQADDLSLRALVERRQAQVMDLLRGTPKSEDLSCGTFSVTLLQQPVLTHQIPIVFPQQAGILGVGPVRDHWDFGEEGEPRLRKRIGISLSYDHRIVNGAYAARFLQAIADRLASAPPLDGDEGELNVG